MWWISIWLPVSAAFVGWAVRARLTIGQGEALAQHIRNARQLLLAVDECVLLPSVAAQECLEPGKERFLWPAPWLLGRGSCQSPFLRRKP